VTAPGGRRHGFLPFATNTFDRVFIAVVTGVAAFLLYFRFLESHVTVWVPFAVWVAWLAVVVRKG
jgi:predicted small integral membrane protein